MGEEISRKGAKLAKQTLSRVPLGLQRIAVQPGPSGKPGHQQRERGHGGHGRQDRHPLDGLNAEELRAEQHSGGDPNKAPMMIPESAVAQFPKKEVYIGPGKVPTAAIEDLRDPLLQPAQFSHKYRLDMQPARVFPGGREYMVSSKEFP